MSIRINVNPTNPGQFFSCCGLLELADRRWPGAEGWFEGREFCIDTQGSQGDLITALTHVKLVQLDSTDDTSSPIEIGEPFRTLRLDWWQDDHAGGKELKVWAGTMESVRIARAKATKDAYAERGFIHVPASGSHGGVIATGGVRRDATLGLAALRLLMVGSDEKKTLALRRYVLGLALTAFTHNPSGYLRQGCLLVLDPDKAKEREFVEVHPTGQRKPVTITHDAAIQYASAAAQAFGVGESRTVEFDRERAKKDVTGAGDTKTKKKSKKEMKLDPNVEIKPDITEGK
jgi:hypothetical protein